MWLFLIIVSIDGDGGHFKDGIFTVKELSRLIEEKSLHVNDDGQETLWNKLVPKKVNIFVRIALKGRLPVRLELDRRDIDLDTSALFVSVCSAVTVDFCLSSWIVSVSGMWFCNCKSVGQFYVWLQ
ncbi:RNA-directed DNA polymerase, eukaryota, reverse transcriptase zinc-binding domain protein, partial [Tanacetum coccineum]